MKPKIPINPLKGGEEFTGKDPQDMSLEELEILLFSKRLAIKLDLERLEKKINYSKMITDVLKGLGVPEKIDKLIKDFYTSAGTKKTDKE